MALGDVANSAVATQALMLSPGSMAHRKVSSDLILGEYTLFVFPYNNTEHSSRVHICWWPLSDFLLVHAAIAAVIVMFIMTLL